MCWSSSADDLSTCWPMTLPLTAWRPRFQPDSTIWWMSGPASLPWPNSKTIPILSLWRWPSNGSATSSRGVRMQPVNPALFQDPAESGLYEAFLAVNSSVESKTSEGGLPGCPDRDRHPARPGGHILRQGHGHGRGRAGAHKSPGAADRHRQHVRTDCRFFKNRRIKI